MKRRIISFILMLTVVLTCTALTSCKKKSKDSSCSHNWKQATCTRPETCSECGKTKGSALGHTGGQATCSAPAVCTRCGTSYGEASGHVWVAGTCTDERYCSLCYVEDGIDENNHHGTVSWIKTAGGHTQGYTCCGALIGSEQPHNLVNGVCSDCGFAPTVSVSSVSGAVGQTVTVTVSLTDNPGLTGMEIKIYFDASKLTLTSVSNGTALNGLTFTASDNLGNGCKCMWDGVSVATNEGDMLTLTFIVNQNATQGEYSIGVEVKGYDDDLAQINFVTNDGSITVQ